MTDIYFIIKKVTLFSSCKGLGVHTDTGINNKKMKGVPEWALRKWNALLLSKT